MSCGPGIIGDWLVPDTPLGLKLRAACKAHDDCYGKADGPDRLECDWRFLVRMLVMVRRYAPKRRRWMFWVAVAYYTAVRLFGWRAFKKARREKIR